MTRPHQHPLVQVAGSVQFGPRPAVIQITCTNSRKERLVLPDLLIVQREIDKSFCRMVHSAERGWLTTVLHLLFCTYTCRCTICFCFPGSSFWSAVSQSTPIRHDISFFLIPPINLRPLSTTTTSTTKSVLPLGLLPPLSFLPILSIPHTPVCRLVPCFIQSIATPLTICLLEE